MAKMLYSGEIVKTMTGRDTSPFPDVSTGTNRKAINTLKRVDEWLKENAINEAVSRKDEFNQLYFYNLNKLSPADRDSINDYLFGEL